VLAGLAAVDHVIVFDEDTPRALVSTLGPDVLVKGADWPEDEIAGRDETLARAGASSASRSSPASPRASCSAASGAPSPHFSPVAYCERQGRAISGRTRPSLLDVP